MDTIIKTRSPIMNRSSRNWLAWWCVAGVVCGSPWERSAQADPSDEPALAAFRAQVAHEPSAGAVVRVALAYQRVDPAALDRLRASSHTRALLPVVSGFGSLTNSGNASASAQTITTPQDTVANSAGQAYTLTLGGSWDLREIVFNPAEVQVYGLVGIAQDISLEVTRAYFQRRILELKLALRPPADIVTRALMELRIAEYGATLDVLTGGWFTRSIAAETTSRE
jgi:hypothetical protein